MFFVAFVFSGCTSITGDSINAWSLADVAELSFAHSLAQGAGEGFGKNDQTSS